MLERVTETQQPQQDEPVATEGQVFPPLTNIIAKPGEPFSFTPILNADRVRALAPHLVAYDEIGDTVEVASVELEGTGVRGEVIFIEVGTHLDDLAEQDYTTLYPAGVARNINVHIDLESASEEELEKVRASIIWEGSSYQMQSETDLSASNSVYFTTNTFWKNGDQEETLVAFPPTALPQVQYQLDY